MSVPNAFQEDLAELCETFGVERLELFGSAATEEFEEGTSDLDFIVRFADRSPGYADRYLDFAEALEKLFDREVDLVTERSIQNPFFRRSVVDDEIVWDIVQNNVPALRRQLQDLLNDGGIEASDR